jgi:hypothetical protein
VAAFAALALAAAARQSPTFDETAHLAAGASYLRTGDFRLNPEHPPLLKALAALPALGRAAASVPEDGPVRRAWDAAPGGENSQWTYAYAWLYGLDARALARFGAARLSEVPTEAALAKSDFVNDADALFGLARLPLVALACALALGVWAWSRELHGPEGALLSLALFCFSPSFLAHSPLVTTDAGFAAFFFGAAWLYGRACRSGRAGGAAAFALCAALAFVSKFSAALLVPALAALGAAHVLDGPPAGRAARARRAALLLALGLAAALAAIWAAYGFRFAGAPGASTGYRWDEALPPGGGVVDAALRLARERRLLPEAYLYGLAFARRRAAERSAYLLGAYATTGWWYYFPIAYALKTPLATMALVAAGLARQAAGRRRAALAWVLAAPAVLVAAAMASRLNIGHRHVLAAYPFLFVAAGAAAAAPLSRPWRGAARAGALAAALSAFAVLAPPWRPQLVFPDFLAYFNEVAGGPERGWRALADSDLDWGQGLKALAAWLRARGVEEPVGLCYFGTAEPRYYGLRYVNLPGGLPFAPQVGFARAPAWVAVSATSLLGVYQDAALRQSWREFLDGGGARLEGKPGRSVFVFRLGRDPKP